MYNDNFFLHKILVLIYFTYSNMYNISDEVVYLIEYHSFFIASNMLEFILRLSPQHGINEQY